MANRNRIDQTTFDKAARKAKASGSRWALKSPLKSSSSSDDADQELSRETGLPVDAVRKLRDAFNKASVTLADHTPSLQP